MGTGVGEDGHWCRGGWTLVQGRMGTGAGEDGHGCRGGWALVQGRMGTGAGELFLSFRT